MNMYEKIREEFKRLPTEYYPDQAGDVDAIIEINLTGEGGGVFVMSIYKKNLLVEEGRANNPDLRATMSTADFMQLRCGEGDVIEMTLRGDIVVDGDRALGLKLRAIVEGGFKP